MERPTKNNFSTVRKNALNVLRKSIGELFRISSVWEVTVVLLHAIENERPHGFGIFHGVDLPQIVSMPLRHIGNAMKHMQDGNCSFLFL
jgi:hypothetical protein